MRLPEIGTGRAPNYKSLGGAVEGGLRQGALRGLVLGDRAATNGFSRLGGVGGGAAAAY